MYRRCDVGYLEILAECSGARRVKTRRDLGRLSNPKGRTRGGEGEGGGEAHPETRARANFNNGDFQAVINEFAEYVLLEMIIESERGGEDKERHGAR